MTNILLITLLIVLISSQVYMDVKHRKMVKIDNNYKINLKKKLVHIESIINNNGKGTEKTNVTIRENKDMLLTIMKDYFDRIDRQEKLIAELKVNQAPKEVSDTVSLINEWMNGAPVEKE